MLETLKRWMLPLGPVLATLVAIVAYREGLPLAASVCAWVACICASWWIFECVHIAVAGLVPLAVFPALGVLSENEAASAYGHPMILLLLGGFFLSAAMENVGAHRRVALTMVQWVGGRGGKRIVFAFMLATASLSMWISNTAATLMMLPIALAVLAQAKNPTLRVPMLLGIAYAASIGGMSTPIGTPPNVLFIGMLDQQFGIQYSFAQWMRVTLPIVAILLPSVWWLVTRKVDEGEPIVVPAPGPWRTSEVRVLVVFALTAVAWIFRTGPYGGWAAWTPNAMLEKNTIGDMTVVIIASLFLFICPRGGNDVADDDGEVTRTLLDWKCAASAPWGILIMFGGGLCLAQGFETTGLSAVIGSQLSVFASAPPWMVIVGVCLTVTFMTEITSSTATASLMLPILGELAISTGMSPESVMIPGVISASCAFMLPVATAPNAIIFSAGGIRTDEMASIGLVINLFAVVLISAVCFSLLA